MNEPLVLPSRQIEIGWDDGATSRFHFVWLRQQFFNPAIGRPDQLPGEAFRLPDDPKALRVRECGIDNGRLLVTWDNDGVRSPHSLDWLRANAYDSTLRAARKLLCVPWDGAEIEQSTWHSWHAVMSEEKALWALYRALSDQGFARLAGAPVAPGSVGRLAEKFGPLRSSDNGREFDVNLVSEGEAERCKEIGSFTTARPNLRTDEPWRYGPPGITFHCVLQSDPAPSGVSIFVDGFLVAKRLGEHDASAFEFLSTVPMRFSGPYHLQTPFFAAASRLISTDQDGDIAGVRFDDRALALQDLPERLTEPAYSALQAFAEELSAPDLIYEHRLQPGEILIFDNHRVLHGYRALDGGIDNHRIQGCTVDREEFHNQLRCLGESLGYEPAAQMILPNGALG